VLRSIYIFPFFSCRIKGKTRQPFLFSVGEKKEGRRAWALSREEKKSLSILFFKGEKKREGRGRCCTTK